MAIGYASLLVCVPTMIGRVLGIAPLVVGLGTHLMMAFNAALLLSLAAVWLIFGQHFAAPARRLVGWLAVAAMVYLALIAIQGPLGIDLGIDLKGLHGLGPVVLEHPGRLKPSSQLGLMMAAAAIALMNVELRISESLRIRSVRVLASLICVIGGWVVLGYLFDLRSIFPWYDVVATSFPTSLTMVGLGIAILLRSTHLAPTEQSATLDEQRIVSVSSALLALVALVGIGVGIVTLQLESVDTFNQDLVEVASAQSRLAVASLHRTAILTRALISAPDIVTRVRLIERGQISADTRSYLAQASTRLTQAGLRSIEFKAADGRVLFATGDFSEAALSIPLAGSFSGSNLVWADALMLDTLVDLEDNGHVWAQARVRVPLTVLQSMMFAKGRPSEETKICANRAGTLVCFPDQTIPRVHESPAISATDGLYPVARAVAGSSGVMRFTDFLGRRVLAAYRPIDDSGLGLVQKLDLSAVYAPLSARLLGLMGIPLLAVLFSVYVLRRGVRPLISRIVSAERSARQAQAQLEISERRIRAIADNVPVRIAYLTPDRHITFANKSFASYAGVEGGTAAGHKYDQLFGEAAVQDKLPYFNRALAGEVVSFERTNKSKGGLQYHAFTYTPDIDEAETVRGVYAMAYEITDLKRAELALVASERQVRAIADSLPALVTYVDADEKYRFVNAYAKTVWHIDPQTLLGRTMRNVAGDPIYDYVRPFVRRALAGETVSFTGETIIRGAKRYYQADYIPEVLEDGSVSGFYGMIQDTTAQVVAQQQLQQSEEKYRTLIEGVSDYAIITLDAEGTITGWNAGAQRIKGYADSEILGRNMSIFYPKEAIAAGLPTRMLEIARKLGRAEDEGWRVRKDGSRFWAKVSITAVYNADSSIRGFTKITRDRTESRRADEALRASVEQLRTITDNLPALICYIDRAHVFRFNNETYSRWLRKPLSEITGRPIRETYGAEVYAQLVEPLERALSGTVVKFEAQFVGWDGIPRYARGTYIPDRNGQGEVVGVHGLIRDVTAAKRAELDLLQAAQFDNLTGLPNRGHFTAKLKEALSIDDSTGNGVALMFLDLDHFKAINDELGHQAGDAVLLEFAHRLRNSVRPSDVVGRLGGDEFVILLTGLHGSDEAQFVARKLLNAMVPQFEIEGRLIKISTSIGIAIRQAGEKETSSLLARADEALYQAKAGGRGAFRLTS